MKLKTLLLAPRSSLDAHEKLNPAQPIISREEGTEKSTSKYNFTFNLAYERLEVVRRGVDLIVNAASEIDIDVKDKLNFKGQAGAVRAKTLSILLNWSPNPYQSTFDFRRNLIMDFIIEGNAFMYWDGESLFHLPADRVKIITDPKTYVKGYQYGGETELYLPDEVIHIKDNSLRSIYRGDSRLKAAEQSMQLINSMLSFQGNFFENSAVPGLVLKTKDMFSQKLKDRILRLWSQRYNPKTGGRRPMILDGGMEIERITENNFKELDFASSVVSHENRILKVLGVPPILLDSGNNANIAPNLKMFYLTTVLPIVKAFIMGYEKFFAYDLAPDVSEVMALRPDLRESAEYYTKLVNNGLMLGAEARSELRLDKLADPVLDKIRIPANVAGSASGVAGQEGGRPTGQTSEED
jgi:HK97 family phage portal protein